MWPNEKLRTIANAERYIPKRQSYKETGILGSRSESPGHFTGKGRATKTFANHPSDLATQATKRRCDTPVDVFGTYKGTYKTP